MALFSTIICCINLTENSDDLVQYTKDIAKIDNAKILIVHALPSAAHLVNYVSHRAVLDEILANSRKRTEEFLQDFVRKHFADTDAEPVLVMGNAAKELLDLADKRCADLIIMGSMSSKGLFGHLISRPSEGVIGATRVPVLVIPNDLSLDCVPPDDFA